MGFSLYYQAIPEGSGLFRLLAEDRGAELVLCSVFHNGGRPLDLRENDDFDDPDLLDPLVGDSEYFGTLAEAEQTMAALMEEIDRTCLAHPGLMNRVMFVEKTSDLIERRLKERIDPGLLAREVTEGGWLFSSDSSFSNGEIVFSDLRLDVVTSPKIKRVSDLLERVESGSIFDEVREDHLLDDFRGLKELYREAADRGEAILIH